MEAFPLKRQASDSDWEEPIYYSEWAGNGNLGFLIDHHAIWGQAPCSSTSPSSSDHSWKRVRYSDEEDDDAQLSATTPSDMRNILPTFFPALPRKTSRPAACAVENPFDEVAESRHKTLRKSQIVTDENGIVNGYVKFKVVKTSQPGRKDSVASNNSFPSTPRHASSNEWQPVESPSIVTTTGSTFGDGTFPRPYHIPPDFGRSLEFDATDKKLFKFYVVAICAGRTLLPKTNGWKEALAPIAESDDCVKHALLAFSSGYVLDYNANEDMRKRTNYHYRMASTLLNKKIKNPTYRGVGNDKADALIAAYRILWCDDIIQWELRDERDLRPRWWRSIKQAKMIMAETDPGYRYYNHRNVQCSTARMSNANLIAYVDILSLVVYSLDLKQTEVCHPWLLQDQEYSIRRIYGGTGLSPKLLHVFGQITHLCAKFVMDVGSDFLPIGAKVINDRLVDFKQWSELSEGYDTTQELLESVVVGEDGLVDSNVKVTELSGEAWVQAARLYLHCRFFRLSRSHKVVQDILATLRKCIEPLPTYGPLFTSQSPLFPVFIMGIVSTSDGDRGVVRHWFESVVSRAGPRSSVPPLWKTLQEIWEWMDNELQEEAIEMVEEGPVGTRLAWWESMVEKIVENRGRITIV